MVVIDHCKMVDPHDGPQPLNARCLLVLNEVPYKQALVLRLYKSIVTLRTACSCTTCCTESASPYPWYLIATRAFEFGQIDSRLVPFIKLIV